MFVTFCIFVNCLTHLPAYKLGNNKPSGPCWYNDCTMTVDLINESQQQGSL